MTTYLHVTGFGRFAWPGEEKAANEAERRVRAALGGFDDERSRHGDVAPQSLGHHLRPAAELSDQELDLVRELLRDSDEVEAARAEIAPLVRDLIASLTEDPLEGAENRPKAAPESTREKAARAARARIRSELEQREAAARTEGRH